jgi:hypothetical protein
LIQIKTERIEFYRIIVLTIHSPYPDYEHMTIREIIRQYDFNFCYARALVRDLDKSQMTSVPYPGFENHPAFTLGHLVSGLRVSLKTWGVNLNYRKVGRSSFFERVRVILNCLMWMC